MTINDLGTLVGATSIETVAATMLGNYGHLEDRRKQAEELYDWLVGKLTTEE
jgi:hypothetical protein